MQGSTQSMPFFKHLTTTLGVFFTGNDDGPWGPTVAFVFWFGAALAFVAVALLARWLAGTSWKTAALAGAALGFLPLAVLNFKRAWKRAAEVYWMQRQPITDITD